MPAMHDVVLSAMEDTLKHKRDILLRTLDFQMTHQECMQLVAPAQHIDILTKAAEFANIHAAEDWMEVYVPATIDGETNSTVMLMMRTHAEQTPPLMPRNPQWQPEQAGYKVIEWLTKRYEIGRRFGTARAVLYKLNSECDSGQQLRYMWPAVLHLCKPGTNERMDKWMDRYAAYRPCRFVPAVSRELKVAIQDSGALLTSMALIGEDVPMPLQGFVDISEGLMPTFWLDGTTVSRM